MPIYSTRLTRNTIRAVLSSATALIVAVSSSGGAQNASGLNSPGVAVWAGGELDNYLRYLQTVGVVETTIPWSLRAFSAHDTQRISSPTALNPWARRLLSAAPRASAALVVLPTELATRVNSAYAYGGNDGAIWAGRGPTVSLQGGIQLHAGPLRVTLAPLASWSANKPFALLPNGLPTSDRFADPYFPVSIDRPQRFGAAAFGRFDWGESTVRLESWHITLGATTANQWWGPATVFPYIVGNNAPGVPQVFFGTASPINLGIGRLQARVVYGLERQSAFSPVQGSPTYLDVSQPGTKRFASGLIFVFQPGAIPTLELGAARYFHQAWFGKVGRSELQSPFEGLLKSSLPVTAAIPGVDNRDALKNQEASIFARWTLPASGFELYGEYGHEDHNADLRDLLSEPDHSRAAMFGARKVARRTANTFLGLRAEVFDATAPTLDRHRQEGLIYPHVVLRQGHTEDGQLIGADAGVGSMSGAVIAVDAYSPTGRFTWYMRRATQAPLTTIGFDFTAPAIVTGTIGFERTQFLSHADIGTGAALVHTTRTAFGTGGTNLNVTLSLKSHAMSW